MEFAYSLAVTKISNILYGLNFVNLIYLHLMPYNKKTRTKRPWGRNMKYKKQHKKLIQKISNFVSLFV